jgi:hypothetical protein
MNNFRNITYNNVRILGRWEHNPKVFISRECGQRYIFRLFDRSSYMSNSITLEKLYNGWKWCLVELDYVYETV